MAVDVWTARIDVRPAALDMLNLLLNRRECAKRDAFRFDRHRYAYVFRRGMLRSVLGASIDADPSRLAFATNAFGKPSLEGASARRGTSFNLSHSGDLVVVAIANRRDVGVDVEQVRPLADMEAIARDVFTSAEHAQVVAAQPPARSDRFFRVWTRKEACVKAVGRGLSMPLKAFDVSAFTPSITLEGRSWTLSDLTMPAGYVGALTVSGPALPVRYREWTPRA